ncbi:efflux transporter outer membrane subunit [Endozoicomonas sp. G2_2]|uniref:efflux transporter outer membrane subunit n=1 Tax=Endozoicomonas sp. G2_2 TaxID=2821092 RepID=UPI001ADBCE25|nr:efflux transporter outer membrane subunit [Endozoicomonas sp. G2_2]MBO9469794.1 efflux transporter outer membrane subunit [Endozoicomonas sp. G2_2]
MRKAILLLAVAGLSACTLGPDYERPTMDLPDSALDATLLSKTQQDAMAYWWTRYRDPVLNELIDDALDDNLDVALQAARFREARAQLGLANANLFPSIQGQAQAARQKTSYLGASSGGSGGAGGGPSSGSGSTQAAGQRYNYFSVAATLSYELDVFGGLRRASEQARAQLLSSAYTQDSIRLGVVSDVVTNYMSLRALERQIRVTQETIKTRQKGLELDQQRYKYGAIDKLTLLQTRSLLETAQAQLPPLQQQASELRSSLAVLTGHTPREIMAGSNVEPGSFEDVHLPEDLPVVMPSLLVERRPDIRAAEASLIAANASIGVAKARFFPTFDLTAMIGTEALDVDDLFEPYSETQSISGAITAPIFDFGRRQANYDTAIAQKDAAEIMYRQTVRQAFSEVRDALVAVNLTDRRLESVQRQVDAYRETLELANVRYDVGRTAYFEVLDAQRQLFNSQLDLAEAIRDRFTATANLFKALGGGWTENSDSLNDELEAARDVYRSDEDTPREASEEPAAQPVSE